MAGFKRFGVPWFAGDESAIRPKLDLTTFCTPTENQIRAVQEQQSLIRFIKKNFQPGDRVEFSSGRKATLLTIKPGDLITGQFDDGKITLKGTIAIERIAICLFKNAKIP